MKAALTKWRQTYSDKYEALIHKIQGHAQEVIVNDIY